MTCRRRSRAGTTASGRHWRSPISADRLRVAWLGEYNLGRLAHHLPPCRNRRFHPAPWLTNGARALADSGLVDLHVVTYSTLLDRDYEFDEQDIHFHVLRTPLPVVPRAAVGYRLDLPRFQATLARIRPHVVHGHGTENVYSLAGVRSPFPHVVSMQGVIGELRKVQKAWTRTGLQYALVAAMERRTLLAADRVLAEAPFVADWVRAVNPRVRATVAGNVVTAEFFGVTRRPCGDPARMFFVGSLVPAKGVEDLLRAFHALATRRQDVELHLVGGASAAYTARLEALAQDGPGAARITFRGFLPPAHIAMEYATAAVMIAPTHCDSSPNAVSEALVAGVPVVASRVGGLPYMLDEGTAGRLVPARDAQALAAALDQSLARPEETAALAARGRTLARTRYSAETFVANVMGAYRDVCGATGPFAQVSRV